MKVNVRFLEFRAETSAPQRKHGVKDFKLVYSYFGHTGSMGFHEIHYLNFLAKEHNIVDEPFVDETRRVTRA